MIDPVVLELALNRIAEPLGWKFHGTELAPVEWLHHGEQRALGLLLCPCGATEYWNFILDPDYRPELEVDMVAYYVCSRALSRAHLVDDVARGTLPASALEHYDRAKARQACEVRP